MKRIFLFSLIYVILVSCKGESSPDMEEGFVGNECMDDDECGGGECFVDEIFILLGEFGYCSVANCQDDSDCPSDANCFINTNIPSIPYMSFCAKKCIDDEDCRVDDGYVCTDESCIPGVL